MLYITNWTDRSRETVNVKYIEFRRKKKCRENLWHLHLQQL